MGANFPDTPTTGDEFVANNLKWTWDGVKWTASGGVAIFADAPEDGNLYGRVNGAWSSGGLISGDLTFRGSAYFAELATSANGVAFVPQVALGGALDLSKHIDLYGGSYGLSITDGALNIVSGEAVQVYGPTTVNGTLYASGQITSGSSIFAQSGIVYSQAGSAGANAHFWLLDENGGDTAGIFYWENTNKTIVLTNRTGGGTIQLLSDASTRISGECWAQYYRCKQGMNGGWGPNGFHAWYDGNGATQWWIDATYFGTLAFNSDYRIKRDLAPLPSMWERLKALKPISYKLRPYKDLIKGDDKERWGLVAHELQETLIEDAATGIKDQEDCIQSPNPWTVIAALTKTLQEAQARIEALEGAR
jgi:hypothetical protein